MLKTLTRLRSSPVATRFARFVVTAGRSTGGGGEVEADGLAIESASHPKTLLCGACSKLKWPSPKFACSMNGPPHKPSFVANVKIYPAGPENTATRNNSNEVFEFSSSAHPNKSKAIFAASLLAYKELQRRGFVSDRTPTLMELDAAANSEECRNDNSDYDADDTGRLLRLYPSLGRLERHPKMIIVQFGQLYRDLDKGYQDPKEQYQLISGWWQCKLEGTSPMPYNVIARSVSKSKAQHAAYLRLVHTLKIAGWFSNNWQPRFHSPNEIRGFKTRRGMKVHLVPISDEIASEIDNIVSMDKEIDVATTAAASIDENTPNSESSLMDPPPTQNSHTNSVTDMITNEVYEPLDERRFFERSHYLFSQLRKRPVASSSSLQLPISSSKKEILNLLSTNRAIIIAGGTGCGKTTQVPQYIFDDHVQRLAGADCNILVTQPRRISAISVARRIAQERGETLADTVGYHVRLESALPEGNGSVLFLTPAMLLRKLWYNPNLDGISHVIVDEVHERDLWTEFLLIILKRAMRTNEKLKIILMSASVDTNKLAEYVGCCPVVNVPGQNYDVEEHFLDDVLSMTGTRLSKELDCENTNHKLVVDTLAYIHENRPEGAILCFLPGWADIAKVRESFRERYRDRSDFLILPCHSHLPMPEQEAIFNPPQPGVRKIVLATNIAETSITVNDVKYVVNTGSAKKRSVDGMVRGIRQEWASQSSQIQRRGRAGRVSDGECFHLFTKEQFAEMRLYELPAMLKDSLESVVLFAKLCCPEEDPEVLLGEALDAPSAAQVHAAIQFLTEMRILDEARHLTALGNHVSRIGCHPMLAVALVYGAIFRCLDPILTVASLLQTDYIVRMMDEAQTEPRPFARELEVKERFVGNTSSDLLALANAFAEYTKAITAGHSAADFANENCLRAENLEHVTALRALFAWELQELGLCSSVDECLDISSRINENSRNIEMVKAVMLAGFHEHLVWIEKGILDRGRILKDKQCLVDKDNRNYVTLSGSLFNPRALLERDWMDQIFLYTDRMVINGTSAFRVDGLTAVNPVSYILFASTDPTYDYNDDGFPSVINLQGRPFQLHASDHLDARRLFELRRIIQKVVDRKLADSSSSSTVSVAEQCALLETRLIPVLVEIMSDRVVTRSSADEQASQL